jgi:hypothetical protein
MNYMALATRPVVVPIPGTEAWRVSEWKELGLVADMEEAKKRFGGSPVLVRVKQ